MTYLNHMLWSFTASNMPLAVRVKFVSVPVSYTPTFTNNQLLDKMEMTLSNINVSSSPSTMYEVRTDTIGLTATGRPLLVLVFAETKEGRMENHDGVNWINNYIEFNNANIENNDGFKGQTLIAMTMCSKNGATMDEIMTVTRSDTVIRWLEVLDNLMMLGPDVDRDIRYLRAYGDVMDMELCRMSGVNSGRDGNGIIMFNTIANISHTITEMWLDHWSLFDVFSMYCSIHWRTVRTLCAIDRGARIVTCVLWKTLRRKTTCHLPVKLVFYDESRTPIFWIDTTNRWTARAN